MNKSRTNRTHRNNYRVTRTRTHKLEDARYLCTTCVGGTIKPHRVYMGETQCEGCKRAEADARARAFRFRSLRMPVQFELFMDVE